MTRELREAGRNLRNHENIHIPKADKTATFVFVNTDVYQRKLSDILNDP